MGINFNDKILVTNPTTYYLGLGIVCTGILIILVGAITYFTGDFLMPPVAWGVLGTPALVTGGIFMACGLTKS